MTTGTGASPKVFVSYSHTDREWLERLRVHLKPLRGSIDIWDDTRIKPGAVWHDEIRRALAGARAAILLVSADFLASDFITTEELPALLKSAGDGGTEILILVLGPCRFHSVEGLARYQTVNDPKEPLIGLTKLKQEELFVSTANLVELALRRGPARGTAPALTDAADAVDPADAGDPADLNPDPAPFSACRDYGNIFDIYVSREQRTMPVGYAAAALSAFIGLALTLAALLLFDFRQDALVVALMIAVGVAAVGVAYFIWRKVSETHAAIETCRFMKRRFDGCERWHPSELKENVQLAIEFLKRGMLKS